MLEKVKYDIGTKVRTKIHYANDQRSEVDAVICGIEIDGEKIELIIRLTSHQQMKIRKWDVLVAQDMSIRMIY